MAAGVPWHLQHRSCPGVARHDQTVASIIRVADLFWFPGWGFSVSSAARAVIMPGVFLQIGLVVPSLETTWEANMLECPSQRYNGRIPFAGFVRTSPSGNPVHTSPTTACRFDRGIYSAARLKAWHRAAQTDSGEEAEQYDDPDPQPPGRTSIDQLGDVNGRRC